MTKYLRLIYFNLLNRQRACWSICLGGAGLVLALAHHPVARGQTSNQTELDELSLVWLLVAGALVFFMNAGFALLEAGLCQTRNAINVLAKNLIVFCVSILAFWGLGFGIMFGDVNSVWGQEGFWFQTFNTPFHNDFPPGFEALAHLYPGQSFVGLFFFQLVFAGTAATIVSGAVAERIKFWLYKSENLIPESPLEWLLKYLKIAREALRVSEPEEIRGSDGTFSPS